MDHIADEALIIEQNKEADEHYICGKKAQYLTGRG